MAPFLPNLVLDDIASPKSTWVPGTLESWVEEALQATNSVPPWQDSSPSPSPALSSECNLDKGGHCNYENINMGSGSGYGSVTNSGHTCGSSREEAVGELQRSPWIKNIKRRPAPSCHSKKRKRDAEVHNLSERKRRDKINRKLEALQELLPICRKIDKATLLDETIAHVKALQSQLQQMRNSINGIQQLVMHPMTEMQGSIQLATNFAHMSKMTQLGYTGMQLLPSQVCPLQSQSAPFLLLHQINNNMAHQDTFRSYMESQHAQMSTDVDLLKKMMDDVSQKYFHIASGSNR